MKKLLLSMAGMLALSTSFGQTSLFFEDFETGAGDFTLNTTTQGGMSGLSGDNAWVVNNSYIGGAGTSSCFGFSFTVGTTPAQPAGISAQNGNYMHILSADGTANNILNANYAAADGSLCFFAQSHFTEMTNDISTVGFSTVTLDFWYMIGGAATQAYGEVYYSTNSGSSWTLLTTPISQYANVTSWTNQMITDPAFANQATIRFGFRFNNGVATTGSEPSFSIDDVEVIGTNGGGGSNDITTGTSLSPTQWCEGTAQAIDVDFTSTGTFNGANVYTAELSDAAGSFAAPTSIGTLASTANSGTISATIPGGTAAGSGYRIRVVSDDPVTVGSDNGADLVIDAAPNVTQQPFADVCSAGGIVTLVGASPVGGTYSGSGVSGTNFDPSVSGLGTFDITYNYTDVNTGCSGSVTEAITVIQSPTVTLDPFTNVCEFDAFFTLTGGTPSNGTYTGAGITAGVFDPSVAGAGTHTITYSFTDANNCVGTATADITVEICGGVADLDAFAFTLQPNPATDVFVITSEVNIEAIVLLDMSGRIVQEYDVNESTFSVENIPSGIYFVRVTSNGQVAEQRLAVK